MDELKTIRITQITDLHVKDFISDSERLNDNKNFERIVNGIIYREIEFVVMTGDSGDRSNFSSITDKLKNRKISYDYIRQP